MVRSLLLVRNSLFLIIMPVRVTLFKTTVTDFMMYDQAYFDKITLQVKDTFLSPKAVWLNSRGIQLKEHRGKSIEDMSVHIAISAVVDEKLATEYYLKF